LLKANRNEAPATPTVSDCGVSAQISAENEDHSSSQVWLSGNEITSPFGSADVGVNTKVTWSLAACARSSFTIVPSACPSAMIAPEASDRLTRNVSFSSESLSPVTWTVTVFFISPGAKVSTVRSILW
jgi:hypothetical protein